MSKPATNSVKKKTPVDPRPQWESPVDRVEVQNFPVFTIYKHQDLKDLIVVVGDELGAAREVVATKFANRLFESFTSGSRGLK